MKIDGKEWMDWLHNMRAKEEEKRMREGISGAEWLRRASAHAQRLLWLAQFLVLKPYRSRPHNGGRERS